MARARSDSRPNAIAAGQRVEEKMRPAPTLCSEELNDARNGSGA